MKKNERKFKNFMKENKSFSELLDSVQDETGKTDEEIALSVGATPGWISQCRNGKQNPGPKLWRRLEALLRADNEPVTPTPVALGNDIRMSIFLDEVSKSAARIGVASVDLLERLYQDHGFDVASKMKGEREAAAKLKRKSESKSLDVLIAQLDLGKRF